MDYSQILSQKQQQTLKLSPRMIQSVNLLTLPVFDLRERILEEAEKNPALEIVRDPLVSGSLSSSGLLPVAGGASMSESDAFQSFLESRPSREETLQEHLLEQLGETAVNEETASFARKIIENLNNRGFHVEPPESLFFPPETERHILSTDQQKLLQKAIDLVRSFDPPGTACADVRESLWIQASLFNDRPILVNELLQNHFELLEKPRVQLIHRLFPSWNEDDIAEALDFIRALDPFPTRRFQTAQVQYAVPDVYVYTNDTDSIDFEDKFTVVAADSDLPVPAISPFFKKLAGEKGSSRETRSFALEQLKDAEWFLNSLSHRTQTLIKVMRAIVRFQKAFFLGVTKVPEPLRMKDVAEAVDVHEATVSRIASGKYVQCSRGLFEIRYFFSNAAVASPGRRDDISKKMVISAASSTSTQIFSREAVKQKIAELLSETDTAALASGDTAKKLSDSALSKKLAECGMPVARRTVAKYRAELNIASSFDREKS